MSDPLLKSEVHAERNTGILATGYDSRIQTYITGQGTPFASGYAKNHILRDLNRRLYNYGLSSYISDDYDAGFRSTTLTGILAAGGGGGGGGGTSVVSTTDLISFWKLDESLGTRYDFFGSNDLTDNNTVGQGTGNVYTNAADFEVANDEYLTVADNAGLRPANFTFSCWVKLESKRAQSIIASKDVYNSNATREWVLDYESGFDRFNFYVFYNSSGGYDVVQANNFGSVSAGVWYHVCVTCNNSEITIRVNGGTADSTSVTSSPRHTSSSPPFAIGAFFSSPGTSGASTEMDGLIEAVGIWSRVLSDAEITALANKDDPFYDQFTVVSKESLVSFWKLDESSGVRYDFFGSNDLTDNNTVGQATSLTGVPYTEGADFERGNTEYLSITDASQSGLSPLSSDFSVSVWVKFESLPGGSALAIIGQDDYGTGTSTDRSWLLSYLTTTNRFTFYLFGGASFTAVEADNFGAASTGTWYHIVATYDATAQETSIQVDGGSANTLSHTIGTNNSTTDFGIALQLNNSVAESTFDGVIQAAGIWSRVLSDAERTALADASNPFYDQF